MALADNAWLRFVTILSLYMGQGVTQGLVVFVIPAWMAANGVDTASIALAVGTMTSPWSVKFLAGFVIDRFTLLSMGRRKAWVLAAQIVAVTGMLVLAFLDPQPTDVFLITVLMTITNGAVGVQDVAVDALTVDIFPEDQREMAGGIAGGGQILGIAAISALGGIAFAESGAVAAFSIAALLLVCVLINLLLVRERLGERLLPWTAGAANPANLALSETRIGQVIKTVWRTTLSGSALAYAPVLFMRGLSYGTIVIFIPIIATQFVGWNEVELGVLNGTAQLVAAILSISVGGYVASKIGAQRWLLFCFAGLLMGAVALHLVQDAWANELTLYLTVFAALILLTFSVIGITVINMRLSPPRAAASQFALYMGLNNIGVSSAGFLIGAFAYLTEPAGMLQLASGAVAIAVLVLLVARYPTRQISDPEF